MFFDPQAIPVPKALASHSASQTKTFEMCERRWTFENLHKLREPARPGGPLELGSALHKQIEDWYLHDREPPSALARAGLLNLPPKGSGLIAIERALVKDFEPALFTGAYPWKGFIDLLFQSFGVTNYADIYDHKTTINLMWAKESADLAEDIQLNVYAKYIFDLDPKIEFVNVHHNYLVTSSMNTTELRSNVITRKENAAQWEHIEVRAKEMQVLSDMAEASQDVNFWQRATPNKSSCGAFGGCPFRPLCDSYDKKPDASTGSLYNFDALPALKEKTMPGLADMLKAKNAAKLNGAAALQASVAAVVASQPPAPVGVLPPDAPAQGPGIAEPPKMTPEALQAAEEAHNKPKRGRRTKAEMEAARAAGEGVWTAPEEPSEQGFVLCIGCTPTMSGSAAVSLEFVLADIQAKAAAQMGIANLYATDYGKKASAITEMLKVYPFTASCYTFTSTDTMLEQIIMAVVAPKAMMVIRGVR